MTIERTKTIVLCAVAFATFCDTAFAAEPRSPDDMGSRSFWTLLAQTWFQITTIVERTLLEDGSKYLDFAFIVMFGMATLKMVLLVTEYIFAKKRFGDLAISISYVLFVFALFKIYGIVIRQVDDGIQGIGSLAQEVALGDNDILSPIKYMRTVVFAYSIEPASIFSGPAQAFSMCCTRSSFSRCSRHSGSLQFRCCCSNTHPATSIAGFVPSSPIRSLS